MGAVILASCMPLPSSLTGKFHGKEAAAVVEVPEAPSFAVSELESNAID